MINPLESFDKVSTEELILRFQTGGSVDIRDNAFYGIVYRFRKDLLEKGEIICRRFRYGPDVAELITQKTFEAFAMKGAFKLEEAAETDIDTAFKIYLYAIARNELTNYYRKQERKRKGIAYDGTEMLLHDVPQVPIGDMDAESRIRYETIQSLTPSQRTVYLTYFVHEKAGANLPKKLQEELRIYLGNVTQSTVRAYKKQATDKIEHSLKMYRLSQKIAI